MRLPLALALTAACGLSSAVFAADTPTPAPAVTKEDVKKEAGEHHRIAHAIKALDEAIEDLKKAPHDFGGHREAAVDACEKAKQELKAALEFRAEKDDKPSK